MDDIKPSQPSSPFPSNLPTPPPASGSQPSRPVPPQAGPISQPPRPTLPSSTPLPPPRPALPPVTPLVRPTTPPSSLTPSSIDVSLKSSIRTMQDDLDAIKRGQTPAGVNLEKKPEPITPLAPTIPKPSAPLPPPRPALPPVTPLVRPALRTSPPAPTPNRPPTTPIPSATPSGVAIPQSSSHVSRRNVRLVILGLVIILSTIGALFYLRSSNETPTPTPTPSTTPTPISVDDLTKIFGSGAIAITIPSSGDPYASISSAKQNANQNEFTFSTINTEESDKLGLTSFLDRLLISYPSELSTITPGTDLLFGISGLTPGVNSKTSVGVVATVTNVATAKSAMSKWETTAPEDLKILFGLTPSLKSSPTFLENVYQGTTIRYMNFSDAGSTIDYAIISLSPDLNLLVITSSKNFIYSIIDLINSSPR